ncbi:MAG: MaoC family dehydratase N-terminal domain-containing protein [Leucobacter sp.]|nr:MaoC family dehydratase N-terminal domain-containing protein [Leucobacter sp.]
METMWYEDAELGVRFSTGARTVTEADVVNFAGVSGDFNELHMNADMMAESQFGARIVHGALVLSIATGLRSQTRLFNESIIAFAEIRSWRFQAPVFIGDTIHVENEVVERRLTSKPDRGLVVQRVDVVNQHGAVVQSGEMVSMLRLKGAAA